MADDRRGLIKNRHLLRLQQFVEGFGRLRHPERDYNKAAPVEQGRKDFPDGEIKSERMKDSPSVVLIKRKQPPAGIMDIDKDHVLYLNALVLAGRAGGGVRVGWRARSTAVR